MPYQKTPQIFPSLVLLALVCCSPARAQDNSSWTDAVVNGQTYVNKGLVAFGFIPANFTESTGDTLGGIGSAIAVQQGSVVKSSDGSSFTGTLLVQPDRGYNIEGTIDYQARHHSIDFVLTPYYGSETLSFVDAQQTLKLIYNNTLLYTERNETKTSGLDALGVRGADNAYADPPLPIASETYPHLSLDLEGFAQGLNETFWASDEYGPYIYQFSPAGELLRAVAPPQAIVPLQNGTLNFTGQVDPETGRSGNQGLEGLSISASGTTLYALLQSAVMQDGGGDKDTNRYTRLLSYNISGLPTLVGEFIVPLPQSKKGKTFPASELHFVKENTFLVLSRDSDGAGGDDNKSAYKQIDLIDISNATDIHGTKYDNSSNPAAAGGALEKAITPAEYVSFVSLVDDDQLARFGLHNDDPSDETLIASKWESISLVSTQDPEYPDDYFLFTAADNDFQTTNGIALGVPYDAGINIDNQVLVFRITLPGAEVLS